MVAPLGLRQISGCVGLLVHDRNALTNIIQEMLDLSAKKGIKPWIEERPMKDANKAVMDLQANKVRYRYTLVNEAHANKS